MCFVKKLNWEIENEVHFIFHVVPVQPKMLKNISQILGRNVTHVISRYLWKVTTPKYYRRSENIYMTQFPIILYLMNGYVPIIDCASWAVFCDCWWFIIIRCHAIIRDDIFHYRPFVRRINSPHKGQWREALIFLLICACTNGWVNSRDVGDLRCHGAHYGVIIMWLHILYKNPSPLQFLDINNLYIFICIFVSNSCVCAFCLHICAVHICGRGH